MAIRRSNRSGWVFAMALLTSIMLAGFARAQEGTAAAGSEPPPNEPGQQKRIFGIIPNYRTFPTLKDYQPISTAEKFKVANDDAWDRGSFMLAAGFGAESDLTNGAPSFGHGVKGYAHYYVTSLADWVVGDYMTEAVVPVLFHEDPRFFRRGTGSKWSRLGYAVGQIFWTRRDSGGFQFNVSEWGGNAAAVALANLYYPDNRNVSDNVYRLGVQIGVDMASNVLKEFSPDITRMFHRHESDASAFLFRVNPPPLANQVP